VGWNKEQEYIILILFLYFNLIRKSKEFSECRNRQTIRDICLHPQRLAIERATYLTLMTLSLMKISWRTHLQRKIVRNSDLDIDSGLHNSSIYGKSFRGSPIRSKLFMGKLSL
jgi:hypothetical protein